MTRSWVAYFLADSPPLSESLHPHFELSAMEAFKTNVSNWEILFTSWVREKQLNEMKGIGQTDIVIHFGMYMFQDALYNKLGFRKPEGTARCSKCDSCRA